MMTYYDGTQTPISRTESGAGARTLTNTSEDGTVSSDDVKNMARNKGYVYFGEFETRDVVVAEW